uniref:Sex-determining region Y protein n=1 Tax=Hydractinia echinata TaxID=3283270 RepID=A0A1P8L002_HYDEC|nr:Sox25 [Hydractinia echinata]
MEALHDVQLTEDKETLTMESNRKPKEERTHNTKVKRPMNAFMLWSKQKRREISRKDPSLHNAQISKLLGEEWKVLDVDAKLPYVEESQKLMMKHKKEHPDYRYKPRQNKLSKNMKTFSTYTPPVLIKGNMPYAPGHFPRYRPYDQHYLSRQDVCPVPGCYECIMYERSYERKYHYCKPFTYAPSMASNCQCNRPRVNTPEEKRSPKAFDVESLIKKTNCHVTKVENEVKRKT